MPRAAILVDPGWMFLIAGLVLVAAATLVPATYDLWVMRAQLKHLEAQERENATRLEAYGRFIADLAEADPQLVRRLAASQLNLVPRGERPMIVASTAQRPPLDWVESSVTPVRAAVVPFPDSLLSRLTLGRKALWIAGAGAMCIFLGLLSSPLRMRLPSRPSLEEAGSRAARALGVPAPAFMAAGGPSLPAAQADSHSSAVAAVRIGADAPAEHDPQPHGAD